VPVSIRSISGERIQFSVKGNSAPVKVLTSSCGPTVANRQVVMGGVAPEFEGDVAEARRRHRCLP
jgi:hypothetical protein